MGELLLLVSKSVPLTWLGSKGREAHFCSFEAILGSWKMLVWRSTTTPFAIFGEGLDQQNDIPGYDFWYHLRRKIWVFLNLRPRITTEMDQFSRVRGFLLWISFLFHPLPLTWKEIYSLSCNPPSPSDYRKDRCGMILKVDLSKKIAVWLHIGSTYDSVLIRNLLSSVILQLQNPPSPPKQRFWGEKIWMFPKIVGFPKSSILIGFSMKNNPFWGTTIFGNPQIYVGFCRQYWIISSNLFRGQRWHPSWGQGHLVGWDS